MKPQLFIKTKMLKNGTFITCKPPNVVFIRLINVKMPTVVGILTFMCVINVLLSSGEHGNGFVTSEPDFGKNQLQTQRDDK